MGDVWGYTDVLGYVQMYWGHRHIPQTYRQPDIPHMPANYTLVLYFLQNISLFHVLLAHQLA